MKITPFLLIHGEVLDTLVSVFLAFSESDFHRLKGRKPPVLSSVRCCGIWRTSIYISRCSLSKPMKYWDSVSAPCQRYARSRYKSPPKSKHLDSSAKLCQRRQYFNPGHSYATSSRKPSKWERELQQRGKSSIPCCLVYYKTIWSSHTITGSSKSWDPLQQCMAQNTIHRFRTIRRNFEEIFLPWCREPMDALEPDWGLKNNVNRANDLLSTRVCLWFVEKRFLSTSSTLANEKKHGGGFRNSVLQMIGPQDLNKGQIRHLAASTK